MSINQDNTKKTKRAIIFKIAVLSLGLLLLGSFWLSLTLASGPLNLVVRPAVPREGEPVLVTFKLNNPSPQVLLTDYQLFANGEPVLWGTTTLTPKSVKTYQYAYENPLRLGEQLNFLVKTQSVDGNFEKLVSLPPAPPQIWSSFISFASFSTSVMSSMSSIVYYQSAFGNGVGLNIGIIVSAILIALLIFMELSQPLLQNRPIAVLGRLRARFSTVTWILFIICMGIVYTTVVTILVA